MAAEPSGHGGGKAGAETKGAAGDMKGQATRKSETTGSGAASSSASQGTEMKPGAAPKAGPKANPKAASDSKANPKAASDSKANNRSRSETTGAGSETNKAAEPKADSTRSQSGATGRSSQPAQSGQSSSTTSATTGSTAGSNVSLTAEQKTKIRTTVIDKGPKIDRTQVKFSLNVGTVVPRTVRVSPVPPILVEIHPAWRGYRYFVVGDELVIVEPDTLRIVAVIAV
jgi:hypothetical protein